MYKELRVKIIWFFVKDVEKLMQYFPDLEDRELIYRSIFWKILGTLKEEE